MDLASDDNDLVEENTRTAIMTHFVKLNDDMAQYKGFVSRFDIIMKTLGLIIEPNTTITALLGSSPLRDRVNYRVHRKEEIQTRELELLGRVKQVIQGTEDLDPASGSDSDKEGKVLDKILESLPANPSHTNHQSSPAVDTHPASGLATLITQPEANGDIIHEYRGHGDVVDGSSGVQWAYLPNADNNEAGGTEPEVRPDDYEMDWFDEDDLYTSVTEDKDRHLKYRKVDDRRVWRNSTMVSTEELQVITNYVTSLIRCEGEYLRDTKTIVEDVLDARLPTIFQNLKEAMHEHKALLEWMGNEFSLA